MNSTELNEKSIFKDKRTKNMLLKIAEQQEETKNRTIDDEEEKSELEEKERYQNAIEMVTNIMRNIGVAAHIKGYCYLREAIMITIENPNNVIAITKELYPDIAKKYKSSPSRIERAIRYAVEFAWKRGNVEKINEIFGCTINSDVGRPTNSQFIATVADYVRIKLKLM